MRVGAALGDLDNLAANRDISIGIVRILKRDRHVGVPADVLVLHPAFGAVEADIVTIEVTPDGSHLRSSVFHHCRELAKRLLLENIAKILWNKLQEIAVDLGICRIRIYEESELFVDYEGKELGNGG